MGYVTTSDLTAYGITDATAPSYIESASKVIDMHVVFPVNGDNFRFPRVGRKVRPNSLLGGSRANFTVRSNYQRYFEAEGDYTGQATLTTGISASVLTLTLTADANEGFSVYPANGSSVFWLRLDDELLLCSAFNTGTGAATVTTRGYAQTLAKIHAAGVMVQVATIPQPVKDAVCEQIIYTLAEGSLFIQQGGADSLTSITLGASKTKQRVSNPLLAPLAEAFLRPYMSRVGAVGWGRA